jgi:hypothetical protein
MMVTVSCSDEVDGLGSIVADLLSDNLLADSSRSKLLQGKPWVVAISIPEAESRFRIILKSDAAAVDVISPQKPILEITTDGDTLIGLPEVPLIVGLPSPFAGSGRDLIAKILNGQLKIRGLVKHPIKVTRVLRLLNTADTA